MYNRNITLPPNRKQKQSLIDFSFSPFTDTRNGLIKFIITLNRRLVKKQVFDL